MKSISKICFSLIALLFISSLAFAELPSKVKVSGNDSTAGYLNGKFVAGTNVTLNEVDDGGNETLVINATVGGTGSAQVLDLGNDAVDESADLAEIATTGDTNSIFTEPTDDKLLIDVTKDWPKADDADDVTCVGCVDDAELATDFISETELSDESELEAQLSDVSDVFTNNDGALDDDDLTDDLLNAISNVLNTSLAQANLLIYDNDDSRWENAVMSGDCTINKTGVISCATASPWTDIGSFLEPDTDGDGIQLNDSGGTKAIQIKHDGTNAVFDIVTSGSYEFPDLINCDTIDTDANGVLSCGTDGSGGGGTPNILDLEDDGGNDSTDLVEIAPVNDTNGVFSEPTADKLLIDLSLNWPSADTADALDADPDDCAANNFATTIAANGNLTCAQPELSNLSDADSDTPLDGHILVYDDTTDNRYENVEVTGDIAITLAGVTTLQAGAVEAGDYAAASIDGDDVNSNIAGDFLTLTGAAPDTLDIDPELSSNCKSFSIITPTDTDDAFAQIYFNQAVTITEIICSTDTGTVTIQFDERAEATPNTGGTDVMTAQLVCDDNSQTTSGFDNATIAAKVPLNLDVDAVASTPGVVRGHVCYDIDDV